MTNQINPNNYNRTDALIRQTEKINSSQNKINQDKNQVNRGQSFQEILDKRINGQVSFSKHANLRTAERNIQITQNDMNRLGDACEKAQQKGIKDALIVMNDAAFIVNTPNKIVVTVVDKNEMQSNVFTQIDGALFL